MSSLKNKIFSWCFLVIILILVFLRENIFLEINALIDGHEFNKAYFYFFNEKLALLSKTDLIKLKWLFTILFIGLISTLSIVIIKLWFANKEYNRIMIWSYAVIFSLTTVLLLLFYSFNIYDQYYFVLRKIIGFINSPIPLFVFFSLFYYMIKLK